jgi:hypothetical protein
LATGFGEGPFRLSGFSVEPDAGVPSEVCTLRFAEDSEVEVGGGAGVFLDLKRHDMFVRFRFQYLSLLAQDNIRPFYCANSRKIESRNACSGFVDSRRLVVIPFGLITSSSRVVSAIGVLATLSHIWSLGLRMRIICSSLFGRVTAAVVCRLGVRSRSQAECREVGKLPRTQEPKN